METSAKAGHNVKSLFKKIAMSLVGMEKEGEAAEAQNASMYLVSAHFSRSWHPNQVLRALVSALSQHVVLASLLAFVFLVMPS